MTRREKLLERMQQAPSEIRFTEVEALGTTALFFSTLGAAIVPIIGPMADSSPWLNRMADARLATLMTFADCWRY